MHFTALALLVTAHALTPNRNIKVARKNTLDSSVTFDEYQNIMVRSRRPVVRRLHAVDATRVHHDDVTTMLRAGPVHRQLRQRVGHRGLPQTHEAVRDRRRAAFVGVDGRGPRGEGREAA